VAFKAKEFGEFECYAPPGFDPAFEVGAGDKLEIGFYRPTDLITGRDVSYFVAHHIEKI
jgi:hypothetical protein